MPNPTENANRISTCDYADNKTNSNGHYAADEAVPQERDGVHLVDAFSTTKTADEMAYTLSKLSLQPNKTEFQYHF